MDIIAMYFQVVFIADDVLSKTPLPHSPAAANLLIDLRAILYVQIQAKCR